MKRLRPLARKLRRWAGRNRPVILLYHRVARIAHDPWVLAVPPDLFAEQMEALSRTRRVVPLARLAEELERGRARANWVAITFDDGYADLLREAVPAMQRFGCPATMFVTTGALGGAGFWWDRLSEAVFRPERLAAALALGAGPDRFTWEPAAGADREQLHMALWQRLRRLRPADREEELAAIERWAGIAPDPERDRAMTAEEVRGLARSGFFSIGAHSVSHAPLPELNRFEKAAEIAGSRRACEEFLGQPVLGFAYPFGDLDPESCEEVRRAGFRFACSTMPGPVRTDSPRYALPRLSVGSWSGDELLRRLP